jgi:hypothetical protein
MILLCFAAGSFSGAGRAHDPDFFPVPPGDEIEVLDPNADPLGRPRVELRDDLKHDGGEPSLRVDIPPAVWVHKYYYTGDRSFQAQLLPGGPTILVMNHPKTGERCYVEAQMLPGAPRVTYTSRSIDYDYGSHGITLTFGLLGRPKIKYRSRPPLKRQVAEAVHAEKWKERTCTAVRATKGLVADSHAALTEAAIDTKSVLSGLTLPVQNLIRVMPLGAAITDPDKAALRREKIAAHRREHQAKLAEKEARRNAQTYRTLR